MSVSDKRLKANSRKLLPCNAHGPISCLQSPEQKAQ